MFVCGDASGNDLPTTPKAYQTSENNAGGDACFISEISSTGKTLLMSTYLGGAGVPGGSDRCYAIALDSLGNVVVVGKTGSTNFPFTTGAYQSTNNNPGSCGFISKLSADGTTLVASTFLGGTGGQDEGGISSESETCNCVTLDSSDNVIVAGATDSPDFPLTSDAVQTKDNNPYYTAFVAKLSADFSTLLHSTFLGGSGGLAGNGDTALGVVLDSNQDAIVCGYTGSTDFPTTSGAYQTTSNMTELSAFVAELPLYNSVSSLSANPGSLLGGQSTTATLALVAKAGVSGITVSLSDGGNSAITFPPSVTVSNGSSTANFQIQSSAVSSATPVTLTATYLGSSQSTVITLEAPTLLELVAAPTEVAGGQSSQGTVILDGPAGASGDVVGLQSSSSAATAASTVTVPAGEVSASFSISTSSVSASTPVTLTAIFNSTQQTAELTVNQPAVSTLTLTPSSVTGGSSSSGTCTLTGPAATGGDIVSLSSSTSEASLPPDATIISGASSAQFNISTVAVSSTTVATITATYNGSHQTTTLTLLPAAVSGLSVAPTVILGGQAVTATVKLNGPAGPNGDVVKLSSSTTEAGVPATVKVAAGASSATFNVTTTAVSSVSVATLKAVYGVTSQTCVVTLIAAPLTGITISPGPVVGGANSTGTIHLEAIAGQYGNVSQARFQHFGSHRANYHHRSHRDHIHHFPNHD